MFLTSTYWQAKFCLFLGICWYSCFIYRYNFIFPNCCKMRSHFEFCPKTVNIQGYSESREPIRLHKNYYPLIWWILRKAMHSSWKKSVIIIYTSQTIKPLHHAVAAQWTPLFGILFEEVLVPTIKDHEHYARTDNIFGLSEVVLTIPFSAQIGLLHLKSAGVYPPVEDLPFLLTP